MEYKQCKLSVKEIGESFIEGYASTFGNIDSGGDVILKGAFKRSLDHHKGIFPVFDGHMGREIGLTKEMYEEDRGLRFIANLYISEDPKMDSKAAREAYIRLKKRQEFNRPQGVSIEYKSIQEDWMEDVRYIKEAKLYGFALVPYPMNEEAYVTNVKSATAFQDLPVDTESAWDADTAIGRVRKWAGGPDKDSIDWRKYSKAFFWYDSENPESFGSYKLPYADVKDGKLYAIARGIYAAAAAIQGARGGVDIPDEDIPKVKSHISKYYEKLDREVPWKSIDLNLDEILTELKEGRMLSSANIEKLNNVIKKLKDTNNEINKLYEEINALLQVATPKPSEELADTMSSSDILLVKSDELINYINELKGRYV